MSSSVTISFVATRGCLSGKVSFFDQQIELTAKPTHQDIRQLPYWNVRAATLFVKDQRGLSGRILSQLP